LIPDSRYASKIKDLQAQEGALTQRITECEAALEKATNIGAQAHPFSWLQDKGKALKREIETLETDIRALQKKIEENTGVMTRPDIITRGGQLKHVQAYCEGWQQQVKQHEARLEQLKPELEKVKKLLAEIEPLIQGR